MKVPADRLADHLKRQLAPVYTITGDDPLLVQEAADLIRSRLRESGYEERELFHAEAGFDWDDVLFSANSMSLFAAKRILEIRMPGGKPGDKGAAAIRSYVESMPDDTVMLLILPRVDASTQRTKWFGALEKAGVLVQVWPITLAQMPRWVAGRFRAAGLQPDRDAVEAMVDRIEGNLLAAIQEIERLKLTADDPRITLQQVMDSVADASRYDVFSLIDAAVGQEPARAHKIVNGLRTEGAEVLYITAMLARELRSLADMASAVAAGKSIDAAMQAARVWQKRKSLVERCLRRQGLETFLEAECRVGRIDKQVKGIERGDPWRELTDVVLALAGKPVAPSPA